MKEEIKENRIMAQEDKQLLLKDICARLPYGVILDVDTTDWKEPQGHIKVKIEGLGILCKDMSLIVNGSYYGKKYKPYLRPMSNMTDEERKEYEGFIIYRKHVNAQGQEWDIDCFSFNNSSRLIDWLNAHHFDYRRLIEKCLAIAVNENNNPYII